MQTGRILIAQDVPDKMAFQKAAFLQAASARSAHVELFEHDITKPTEELLRPLRVCTAWYDWAVVDLVVEGKEEFGARSTGLNLVRQIVEGGFFGAYGPRSMPPTGIRNIAVCSACIGYGGMMQTELKEELLRLGVDLTWVAGPPRIHNLANAILDRLDAEGALSTKEL